MLYQGFENKHFYWEFINSLRKISILCTFMLPFKLQILSSVTILVLSCRLQVYLKPYKEKDNERVELIGISSSIITLCCGLIFSSSNTHRSMDVLILIIMFVWNAYFILQWLILLIKCLSGKYRFFKSMLDLLAKLHLCKNLKNTKASAPKAGKKLRKRLRKVKKRKRVKFLS